MLYINVLRNQHKLAIRTKRRGLLPSGMCLQCDNARAPTASTPRNKFRTGSLTPLAIFTEDGTQWFLDLLAPKRRHTWTSGQIGWEGKGGDAWLADTAPTRLLLPNNLRLSGTLKAVRRTWCWLNGRQTSLCFIYFYCNLLYVFFFPFLFKWPWKLESIGLAKTFPFIYGTN